MDGRAWPRGLDKSAKTEEGLCMRVGFDSIKVLVLVSKVSLTREMPRCAGSNFPSDSVVLEKAADADSSAAGIRVPERSLVDSGQPTSSPPGGCCLRPVRRCSERSGIKISIANKSS